MKINNFFYILLLLIIISCNDSDEIENSCENINCSNHGFCVLLQNKPYCICDATYINNYENETPLCIPDITDPCSDVDCNNHGVCAIMGSRPICICDTGYIHDSSDINNPKCLSPEDIYCNDFDCGEHGSCYVYQQEPKCECDDGYKVVDNQCVTITCDGINCSGAGRCIKDGNNISCDCDIGYEAVGLQCLPDDRDRCENVQCNEYRECNPDTGYCDLKDGRCATNYDCPLETPYCDIEEHVCSYGDETPCLPNPCNEDHKRDCVVIESNPYCLCENHYKENIFGDCVYDCSFLPFSETNEENSGCNCVDQYHFENGFCLYNCPENSHIAPSNDICICDMFYEGDSCYSSDRYILTGGGIEYDSVEKISFNGENFCYGGEYSNRINLNLTNSFTDETISEGDKDIFISCLNENGIYRWSRSFGWGGVDQLKDITFDQNGDLYILGEFEGSIIIDNILHISNGGIDIFVAKISKNGDFLWFKTGGGLGDDIASSILINEENIYITGGYSGVANFGNFISIPNNGVYDIYLWILNISNGEDINFKYFGGEGKDIGQKIFITDIGKVGLLGNFQNRINFNTDGGENIVIGTGGFISYFNLIGEYIETKFYPYISFIDAIQIVNNLYSIGTFTGIIDIDPGDPLEQYQSKGLKDIFIMKHTVEGSYLWGNTIGGVEDDYVTNLINLNNTLYFGLNCSDSCQIGGNIYDNGGNFLISVLGENLNIVDTIDGDIKIKTIEAYDNKIWIGGYFNGIFNDITSRDYDMFIYGIKNW